MLKKELHFLNAHSVLAKSLLMTVSVAHHCMGHNYGPTGRHPLWSNSLAEHPGVGPSLSGRKKSGSFPASSKTEGYLISQ